MGVAIKGPTRVPAVNARVRTWVVRIRWSRGWSSANDACGQNRDIVVCAVLVLVECDDVCCRKQLIVICDV